MHHENCKTNLISIGDKKVTKIVLKPKKKRWRTWEEDTCIRTLIDPACVLYIHLCGFLSRNKLNIWILQLSSNIHWIKCLNLNSWNQIKTLLKNHIWKIEELASPVIVNIVNICLLVFNFVSFLFLFFLSFVSLCPDFSQINSITFLIISWSSDKWK